LEKVALKKNVVVTEKKEVKLTKVDEAEKNLNYNVGFKLENPEQDSYRGGRGRGGRGQGRGNQGRGNQNRGGYQNQNNRNDGFKFSQDDFPELK